MDPLTRTFKALSDPTRLRMVMLLHDGELCLCQIIPIFDLAPSTISKHLSILLDAGLIDRRRDGRWQYFSLKLDEQTPTNHDIIKLTIKHMQWDPQIKADLQRLMDIKNHPIEELTQCYKS